MFPGRYFGARYFGPRYFPQAGLTIVFNPQWAEDSTQLVGPIAPQPITP